MNRAKIAQYGGSILADGTLEMIDPNDDAHHRYQYAVIHGVPSRRMLPARGDYDPPATWERIDVDSFPQGYHPIRDYFKF